MKPNPFYPRGANAAVSGRINPSGGVLSDVMAQAQQANVPARVQPQVMSALERLNYCADDLANALSSLSERLAPVLMPVLGGVAIGGEVAPEPVRCDVAFGIDATSDRLCAFTQDLRGLLDRLEV